MKITVTRDIFTDNSTASMVHIDDSFFCYGLEDVDRRLEEDISRKVYGKTAIPRGKYKVGVTFSNRFQALMPQVMDVPGFEGIRIHPGNTAADTHGCLLVGMHREKDKVALSRAAYQSLFNAITRAIARGNEVWIEYR